MSFVVVFAAENVEKIFQRKINPKLVPVTSEAPAQTKLIHRFRYHHLNIVRNKQVLDRPALMLSQRDLQRRRQSKIECEIEKVVERGRERRSQLVDDKIKRRVCLLLHGMNSPFSCDYRQFAICFSRVSLWRKLSFCVDTMRHVVWPCRLDVGSKVMRRRSRQRHYFLNE